MNKPSLIVLSSSSKAPLQKKVTLSGLSKKRVETKAIFDRKWLQDPYQFQVKGAIDHKRLQSTKDLIDKYASKSILDIGCGFGDLSIYCHKKGLNVKACEISKNALPHLKILEEKGVEITIDQLPFTDFKDGLFDTVLCTETIGEISPREYRLTFSELSRILKPKGILICSTSFDAKAYMPHFSFIKLAETEFQTIDINYGYHYIFEALLNHLSSFKLTSKLSLFCKNSKRVMGFLESMTKIFLGDKGITHIIYIGTKKSLF